MKVKLINATPNPEELVCTAARNDYREGGVIGHSFEELMEPIEETEDHVERGMDEVARIRNVGKGETKEEAEQSWERKARLIAKKRTLIDHLIKSGHWGPFEHPSATVAIEGVTRVVTHQIVRHRHFTFDQQSFRYVGLEDAFGQLPFDRAEIAEHFQFPEFRGDDFEVDREGVHEFDDRDNIDDVYAAGYSSAIENYQRLRALDVPKEQARKVLPMGTLTNIVMSGNARAWMHILLVRQKSDVQGETRRCADAIFEELKGWMPYAFEAYDDKRPMELTP